MQFQHGLFCDLLDRSLAHPMETAGLRLKLIAVTLAMLPEVQAGMPYIAGRLSRIFKSRSDLGALVTAIKAIDDTVDVMEPAQVLAAGHTDLGEEPCAFLRNTDVVLPAYLQILHRIDKAGLASYGLSISYSNLFARHVQNVAALQVGAGNDPSAKRQEMAEENITLSALSTTFAFSLLAPSRKLEKTGRVDAIDDVRNAHPQLYQLARAMQYIDDLRDVLIDLDYEARTGRSTCNAILAEAIDDPATFEKIMSRWKTDLSSAQHKSYEEMPGELQRGIKRATVRFFQEVKPIKGVISKALAGSFWRNCIREGFMTPQHPVIQHNNAYNEAKYAALRLGT